MKKKEYKDVKKFTISRTKWSRGGINNASCLLDEKGNMCCLGFYAIACGLRPQDIKNFADPEDICLKKNKNWNTFLVQDHESLYLSNSSDTDDLIDINDSKLTTDASKEKKISKIFSKHGVKVKFVK